MDIVLIQSPCWGIYAPPLGLASLSAFLRERGFYVSVLDLNIDMFYRCKDEYKRFWQEAEHEFWRNDSLVQKLYQDNQELVDGYIKNICSQNTKVIGFSVYDTSMYFSLLLAKKIKEACPHIVVVFGGPHCSRFMCRDFIISQEDVDVVVEGEGEEALADIMAVVVKEQELKYCPGSLIKKAEEMINSGERSLIDNLDTLPFPDFSDFPIGSYLRKDTIPVSTSRGCVNRCIFCYEWLYWKRYRYKTGYYIFQEIKHQISKYPFIKNIEFYDSLLNGNLKELSILCDLIIKEKIRIRWGGQAIIHGGMDFGLLSKFKKSGCGCLNYGIESGSQNVLDKIRKGFKIKEAERIIKHTYEAGIDVALNFMFGHPGEAEDDFKETLDFVSRNRNYISIVNPSPSFFGIALGTYVYNHPEEFGISIPINNGFFWKLNDNSNNFLIRLNRFERFSEFVHSLGIKSTYPTVSLANRHRLIGDYYFYSRNYQEALENYRFSIEKEGENKNILQQTEKCLQALSQDF